MSIESPPGRRPRTGSRPQTPTTSRPSARSGAGGATRRNSAGSGTGVRSGGSARPRSGSRTGAGNRSTQRRPVARRVRRIRRGDPHRRLRLALVLMAMILSLYVGKLVDIQVVNAAPLADRAQAALLHTVDLPAARGTILDAQGVPLATTVEARNITVDQALVKNPASSAAQLARVLHISASDLRDRLTGTRRFVYLAKGVTPQLWHRIEALSVPGIFSERTTVRVYPAGAVAANVVGFVGADGRGLGGLEYGLENELAGKDGSLTYERAAGGRQIPTGSRSGTEAVAGLGVRLTIDRDIQWVAQQSLADAVRAAGADSGTAVVMDPRTGRILALADVPTFDPNRPAETAQADRGNRALTDAYEPGSTSKVMTMAAVVESGKATARSPIVVPPTLTRAGKVFHDHNPHGTLRLTLAGVLAKSSNIGTILASERIGPQALYSYLRKFGIAEPTGLQFPGENRGLLPSPENWSGTSFPTIAFGQGLSVNAVQAASVYSTIANDGVRVSPSLVSSYVNPDGSTSGSSPSRAVRVVSPATAKMVREMLESAVSDEGTAPMARIPGYRVAGKTGTAFRVDPRCSCYKGYVASFIGMAPADAPRLVVAVSIQNPRRGHFGGVLAGPVFKKVMSFALQDQRIPPTGSRSPHMRLTW